MHRALDFDKTPALGVPLPFFLNVPVFLLFSGLLLTWEGPAAFASRWGSNALTLTHLWTLGIMGSTMLGALIQILPVACNVPVGRGYFPSWPVYGFFTVGCLALCGGFYFWQPMWLKVAVVLLIIAFLIYFGSVGWALWQHRRQVYPGAREILVAVRGALLALAITVLLGFTMAWALGSGFSLAPWVNSHIVWGLTGWGGLLLMGMSFQLIPIFQITELYPKWMTRWLPLAVLVLLLAWSSLYSGETPNPLYRFAEAALVAAYAIWAVATLHLLHTRKRASHGPTSLFWFTSMYSLLACVLVWIAHWFNPSAQTVLAMGVLIIVGVFGSVITGQLYKIVSFLLWKHGQDAVKIPDDNPLEVKKFLHVVPKMQAYVRPTPALTHWWLHLALVVVWVLAVFGWTPAKALAGPLLLAVSVVFIANILYALRLYRQTLHAIARLEAEGA